MQRLAYAKLALESAWVSANSCRQLPIYTRPISTDDVFAIAATLKQKGMELAEEPKKEVWGTMAKFKDPDGNEFVFSSR